MVAGGQHVLHLDQPVRRLLLQDRRLALPVRTGRGPAVQAELRLPRLDLGVPSLGRRHVLLAGRDQQRHLPQQRAVRQLVLEVGPGLYGGGFMLLHRLALKPVPEH